MYLDIYRPHPKDGGTLCFYRRLLTGVGYPSPNGGGGNNPHPLPDRVPPPLHWGLDGVPYQGLDGATPCQDWMGVIYPPTPPPVRACHRPDMLWSVYLLHFTYPVLTGGGGEGTSSSSWWEVPPLSPTGEGVPLSTPWWATPPPLGTAWAYPSYQGLDEDTPPSIGDFPPGKSKPRTGYAAVGTPLAFHAVGLSCTISTHY